jgi:hypothetical protein
MMVVLRWTFIMDIICQGCVVGELVHAYDVSYKRCNNHQVIMYVVGEFATYNG